MDSELSGDRIIPESASHSRKRLLIVDDHPIVCEAIQLRFVGDPEIEVVGTAGDAEAAIEIALKLLPDIVIMDIDMPGLSCFDAVRRIQSRDPNIRFIFHTAFRHDHFVKQALDVKAMGFLLKTDPAPDCVEAVRAVAKGRTWFSKSIRELIVAEASRPGDDVVARSGLGALTPKECDVVRYIARGLSNKEIASVMSVSPKTVENHCTHLMRKLCVKDRVDVARFAIREGLERP